MDSNLREQALEVAETLPKLVRRFFVIDTEGPTAELPVAQLRVCGILASGQRTMSALSKELGISLSAVTQVADRLERAGLVERVVEGGDHRVKCLQLTECGRQVVERRNAARAQRIADVLTRMDSAERELAVAGLKALARQTTDGNEAGSDPHPRRAESTSRTGSGSAS
jgi:DNA-binding MarR family transcriptional regulator